MATPRIDAHQHFWAYDAEQYPWIPKATPLHRDWYPADLEREQAEILILIRAFDDTFSQVVHARHSYRHEELVWNAKFLPAFNFDEHGDMVLHLDRLDNIEKIGS